MHIYKYAQYAYFIIYIYTYSIVSGVIEVNEITKSYRWMSVCVCVCVCVCACKQSKIHILYSSSVNEIINK